MHLIELKTCPHKTLIQMFIADLFINGQNWKLKCPSIDKWINNQSTSILIDYYSAVKTNELLSHKKK